ncbi:hypothetical protein [Pengzhenrongella frigida]|uniref:Peptidoglycan-binding protein n=1 Tax=Pengzhenrongella frigida TaxID=1259133 RepID=A0A4Q5N5S8_9MICO|nr:hypothetical protein [Cellulomonas sp. HLT2-17]RYV52943.1 hypothetical protein EUA98_00150 [Cellulomonas sp. HLT2-17]
MAVTAVIALVAGLGLSRLITSPAEAAANAAPPTAGPITVPVERRVLATDVVLRGDAVYEDPASITLETGDLGGPAVVTGQVPEVGATLNAGDLVLELAGRPVILLPGDLPVYRTLRAGVSGPDVVQLKAALVALGIDPGDPSSPAYDAATAAGVAALYARAGYPAPSAGEEAELALAGARDATRAADDQVASAERALTAAKAGPGQVDLVTKDNQIRVAQRALADAQELVGQVDPDTGRPMVTASEIANLTDQVTAASVDRDALLAPADTSEERAALTAAQRARTEAGTDLTTAQRNVLTPLPSSEIVYLTSIPRRVDSVEVHRGSTVAGTAVMSVSGAALQIAGSVVASDADLIAVGTVVAIALPGGDEVPGTVVSIGAPVEGADADAAAEKADANRTRVIVVPAELTEPQRAELQGANVRMTIRVSATDGEVLAVPTAALTAGPGGEARVEVLADDGTSTLVTVETGLAADGFVEVTSTAAALAEGDRVVVGVTGSTTEDEPEDEPTSADSDAP